MQRSPRRGHAMLEYVVILMLVGGLSIGFLGRFVATVDDTFGTIDDALHTDDGSGPSRSGLGDGSNPGSGGGRDHSPNDGTDNPHDDHADGGGGPFFP